MTRDEVTAGEWEEGRRTGRDLEHESVDELRLRLCKYEAMQRCSPALHMMCGGDRRGEEKLLGESLPDPASQVPRRAVHRLIRSPCGTNFGSQISSPQKPKLQSDLSNFARQFAQTDSIADFSIGICKRTTKRIIRAPDHGASTASCTSRTEAAYRDTGASTGRTRRQAALACGQQRPPKTRAQESLLRRAPLLLARLPVAQPRTAPPPPPPHARLLPPPLRGRAPLRCGCGRAVPSLDRARTARAARAAAAADPLLAVTLQTRAAVSITQGTGGGLRGMALRGLRASESERSGCSRGQLDEGAKATAPAVASGA